MSANTKPDPAKLADARALWGKYDAFSGAERTRFRHAHEEALSEAAELVDCADAAEASPPPVIDDAELARARALLARYEAQSGGDRSRFFLAHEAALFAAAELVDRAAAESQTSKSTC